MVRHGFQFLLYSPNDSFDALVSITESKLKEGKGGASVVVTVTEDVPFLMNQLKVNLSAVQEGHITFTLVENVTEGPVRVKHGFYLGDELVYHQKVLPTPLEFPAACVTTASCTTDMELEQGPTLRSLVNVVDYLELMHSLLDFIKKHPDMISLPGKPLGSTEHAENCIFLKPNN
ncbi:hypothetical protein E2C01_055805 [Portunus trituberculatus]|uniref:Uncharacterized protein n=1 Tax=Portunus trituberculatus TaxID=210409 RepID=A0A5B7GNG5_PORTR|nr:hypothetical protein [Portunus trituberculatus]